MTNQPLFADDAADLRPSGACPACGTTAVVHVEKPPHIGEYCAACGKWLRWVPKAKTKEARP